MGESMGVKINDKKPIIEKADSRNTDSVSVAFNNIFKKKNVEIVLVYIPNRETNIYTVIKQCSDVKYKIPSQVMVTKSVLKGGMQYSSNVWLKVNGKCGGYNFTTISPKSSLKNPLVYNFYYIRLLFLLV